MNIKSLIRYTLKTAVRRVGLDVRYACQNPSISDPRFWDNWMRRETVRVIFDVGANIGQTAVRWAAAYPTATIHCFEPFSVTHAILSKNLVHLAPRVLPHKLACGDRCENLLVPRATRPAESNSITRGAAAADTEEISVTTLDEFARLNGIGRIDLLKTDTEGHDAKVLAGATGLLRGGHVGAVVTEVGFYGDEHHSAFHEVYSILTSTGYHLAAIVEPSFYRHLRPIFANAVFVRD